MKKVLGTIALVVVVVALGIGWKIYQTIKGPATAFAGVDRTIFLTETNSLEALADQLLQDSIIVSKEDFLQVAGLKQITTLSVKPGRYRFKKGASLNRILNKLRAGNQEPVQLTFTGYRTAAEIAGRVSEQIAADSLDVLTLMQNDSLAKVYGFNSETFRTMFIPNTYEVWYTTNANDFIERMHDEHERFWSEARKAKATQLGMTPTEVSILASIVKAETAKRDEAPKVAGLYLNRLEIGMALQADPTLIYALGDFSIKRVLDVHKEVDSPYNTYRNAGLPPGPINFPEPHYIDAVLNAIDHEYLYMCAKPDFSGYHNFSRTLSQHNVYANQYRRALTREMREARRREN